MVVTYTGRLLATPNPISLTDSGDGAHQQVGGMAVEPDLRPAQATKHFSLQTQQHRKSSPFVQLTLVLDGSYYSAQLKSIFCLPCVELTDVEMSNFMLLSRRLIT